MKFLVCMLTLISTITFANCSDIKKFKLALEVHASNWANKNTTRTPEGGAYKVKSLECKNVCRIIEKNSTYTKYEPGHPDANKNGYVNYPVIDTSKERAAIGTYAKSIHLLATKCHKKVTSTGNKDSLLINYIDSDVKQDIFNFDKSNKVISWVREISGGKTQILNF